jgi:hypothetical protein
MNVCVVCHSRVGGTSFGNWLSKELGLDYIHEPFNKNHEKSYEHIDYSENKFVIKLEPERLELIKTDKIIVGLIRENTLDCAISLVHALHSDKWHREYTITQCWIDDNIEEIKEMEIKIKNENNSIKEMYTDILVTYEGIYDTHTDIPKLQQFFNVKSFSYISQYLNPKMRYRNRLKIII